MKGGVIAPNRFIAKVAAAMEKPDGITVIPRPALPGPLLKLRLTDLPGISKGINRRLRAAGIHTVADLYFQSERRLREAWGSVVGVYWWHWLRGEQLAGPVGVRRTIGHQHVLSPELRSRKHARGVSLRLLAKASQRMRHLGFTTSRLSMHIQLVGGRSWGDWTPLHPTIDLIELKDALMSLWRDAPDGEVMQIGVRLEELSPADTQLLLFGTDSKRSDLMQALDHINSKIGVDTVYLGSMHDERHAAPRRIPFGKPPDLNLPDRSG